MVLTSVYTASERFKYGWTAGFYDAISDDGVRYLDDILRYGAVSDEQKAFMAGYRAGQRARRGTLPYVPDKLAPIFEAAA